MRAMIPLYLLLAMKAWTLPQDLTVKEGKVDLMPGKDTLQVLASDRSILNWKQFSIGSNERVEFVLPSSKSAMLNRVTGGSRSELMGLLQSNGQIYLINPAGVIIGKDAVINTAAFTYSTLDIKDSDFLEGIFHFTGESEGTISHMGTIQAREGDVHLFARKYEGEGNVSAPLGNVEIAAGTDILLKTDQSSLLTVKPDLKGFSIEPEGKLEALNVYLQSDSAYDLAVNSSAKVQLVREGGKVLIRTSGGKIQLNGEVNAPNGSITIHIPEGDSLLFQSAALTAESVDIAVPKMIHNGSISADGAESGGKISIHAKMFLENRSSKLSADGNAEGGTIEVNADHLFTSGKHSAQGAAGGSIHLLGDEIKLSAAEINASGSSSGGEILIGGDAHGKNPEVRNAQTVFVSSSSRVHAEGEEGKIIVWSDERTMNYGFIKGGEKAFVEVSGKQLAQSGKIEAPNGTILLDPATIIIDDTIGTYPHYALVNPTGDGGYGNIVLVRPNGNVVVTNRNDSTGGGGAGAVFYFDSVTGALISTLVGNAGDGIPDSVTGLTGTSNFLVGSSTLNPGGALTFVNGTTGLNGVISAANSLVGSSFGDGVGQVYSVLTNGSYVSLAPFWDNGATSNVGAITWGNGTTGISGTVSVANSLIGSLMGDQVGINGAVTALTNGGFVIGSPGWSGNRGAVSWGSGTSPVTGTVSAVNSLIGTTAGDQIGNITYALTNGNYFAISAFWDNGGDTNAGAATWGNGTTGTFGTVSTANSLYGKGGDEVGLEGSVLTNGNYVIKSNLWSNGVSQVGAVTWGNGATGSVGLVTPSNSLVGSTVNDQVGGFTSVFPLTNGNYVTTTPMWNDPVNTLTQVGAATWCDGMGGTVGTVSAANSLIGTVAFERVGSGTTVPLTNGNYLVFSPLWTDGGTFGGAVTWGNGSTGTTGTVSSANSLVGNSGDEVGNIGGLALTNGNYLVISTTWSSGRGAVTWGNGSTGTSGIVDATNSLVGTTANDGVGSKFIALTNGNYVVGAQNWDNISTGATNAGAATWGNGTTGVSGTITAANSLVGTGTNNSISSSLLQALTDGNYVVRSSGWDLPSPATNNVGAVTWGNGTTGTVGTVSAANSLIGSHVNDAVGSGNSLVLANGGFIVQSTNWDDGSTTNAGAATYFPAGRGIVGTVTVQNSITGPSASAGLTTPQDIASENTFITNFQSVGVVYVGLENPSQLTAERAEGDTLTIPSSFILNALNYGTNANLEATDTITISTPIVVTPVTGAGNLSLIANTIEIEADITQAGAGGISIRGENSFTISNGVDITTQNGDILLYSNQSLIAEGGGNIESFGSGNVDLVAQNGVFQIHDPFTINVGSGHLSIYAVNPASANLPSTINGAPYNQFGPFNFFNFGVFFPNGNPSGPFSVFYQEPFAGINGLFEYYSSLSEAYYKWTVQFFGPYLDWDQFPPYETPKGLNFYLPSLVNGDLDHPPEDFIYEK